ncbi:MAG TPA: bifunctional isocitrate dehydrogenase kinase/phosphatase [Rhodocyclaceae bacterium]
MPLPRETVAQRLAQAMIEGFDKHYRLFRNCSALAKARFEAADWAGVQQAVRERISYYECRVIETVAQMHDEFGADVHDEAVWRAAKLFYIGLLTDHKQPELAETFFNSVFCRIMKRTYFHNDFIFVRPATSTEYIESDPPSYRSYYPGREGYRESIRNLLLDYKWTREFDDLERDVDRVIRFAERYTGRWPQPEANLQIQVLDSAFYRNKAAYVIGKVINGANEYPFMAPVLQSSGGKLYVDTVLFDADHIRTLFSLSRAYFMVDMQVPANYVQFLRTIMPNKPRSEVYTMLGLCKQGKTAFYRGLISHLHNSRDQFVVAPGIEGLVMLVFTLPSYPYVFKVIKDEFGASKEVDRDTVKRKYQLVKQVDRVGRLADTLEFSQVALPKARFSPELLEELYAQVPSQLEEDGDDLVIRHAYIERRMVPLNIYLEKADRDGRHDLVDAVVREYGKAVRELAIANIFPGDLLWKNFGVTRFGRVVFYDYDEIELMTDCNFRDIPPAPDYDSEMSGEAWYPVRRNDVFPEEFPRFLLVSDRVRDAFVRHNADLLGADFWRQTQAAIRGGEVGDFFPYPESMRFCHQFDAEAKRR